MLFYISQPMRGKGINEINMTRDKVVEVVLNNVSDPLFWHLEFPVSKVENVKFKDAYCLGNSIQDLAMCDALVLAPGWSDARGCKIEFLVAKWYGIPIYTVEGGELYGEE